MVKPKKHFGQHFLTDARISKKIAECLDESACSKAVLEIGPGTGALTRYLAQNHPKLYLLEIDRESVTYLKKHFPALKSRIIEGDFLKIDFLKVTGSPITVIGNFPYNISTQILFRVLEFRDQIPEVLGMFQKEVAERIVAPPGGKTPGILSVLLQTWYHTEYLFEVEKECFSPPPKVHSAVIRLRRNSRQTLGTNEQLYKSLIKMAFNQRRKTLRNALKPLIRFRNIDTNDAVFSMRAEQLGVTDFIALTRRFEEAQNGPAGSR